MPSRIETEELSRISENARAYTQVFQLPLNDRKWRGPVGEFAGSGVGSSLDFQDHRAYQPGDDPRHINWQAYARTGMYTMKLYREEVRPMVEVIFDGTGSMFLDENKTNRSLELFYFANFAAARAGATVANYVVKGPNHLRLTSDSVITHRWMEELFELPSTESSAAPNLSPLHFRPQSLRILISDLLHPGDPESYLRELTHGNGRAIVWSPYTEAESNPQWSGNYEFVDSETDAIQSRRIDAPLMRRYLEAYRRHFDLWKTAGVRYQVPIALISSFGTFEVSIRAEAISAGAFAM